MGGQLVLTVVVTWFIADRLGLGLEELSSLDPAEWRPHGPLIVASALLFIAGNIFSGFLWGETVRDLGGSQLGVGAGVRIFLIANLGRYIPGKIWQVAGLAVLAKRRGVPGALSGVTAVVAHGMSLVAAGLVGSLVFATGAVPGSDLTRWIPLFAAAAVGLSLLPPIFRRVVSILARTRLDLDWDALQPKLALKWLALFIVHWGVYGASFVLLARSFGLPGQPHEVLTAYVAAYVVGYLALFAPAGIGVRELSLTALLAPLMGEVPAAGLAIVARVWSTVFEIIPAAVMWGLEVASGNAEAVKDDGGSPPVGT